jgi:hypothetical protein
MPDDHERKSGPYFDYTKGVTRPKPNDLEVKYPWNESRFDDLLTTKWPMPKLDLDKFEAVQQTDPWYTDPKRDTLTELRKMLLEMQIEVGPPKPITPYDERLYAMARDLGFSPVGDTQFSLDFQNNLLRIASLAPGAERVLSVAHELGHAARYRAGRLDTSIIMRWNARGALKSNELRYIVQEELLAWRGGMKIIRSLGVRFSSPPLARQFRQLCLSTYRLSTNQRTGAIRHLKIEE